MRQFPVVRANFSPDDGRFTPIEDPAARARMRLIGGIVLEGLLIGVVMALVAIALYVAPIFMVPAP